MNIKTYLPQKKEDVLSNDYFYCDVYVLLDGINNQIFCKESFIKWVKNK